MATDSGGMHGRELEYVRQVRLRLAYIQGQLDYAIPRAIECLEARKEKLVRIGGKLSEVLDIGDRVADLCDEMDLLDQEASSGAIVVSWSKDATDPAAQEQIHADDADLMRAKARFQMVLRGGDDTQ